MEMPGRTNPILPVASASQLNAADRIRIAEADAVTLKQAAFAVGEAVLSAVEAAADIGVWTTMWGKATMVEACSISITDDLLLYPVLA